MSNEMRYDVLKVLAESSTWSERSENVGTINIYFSSIAYLPSSQAILEPFTHIAAVPGKDFRGQMIESFNTWLDVPADKLHTISQVINMLHNASLL